MVTKGSTSRFLNLNRARVLALRLARFLVIGVVALVIGVMQSSQSPVHAAVLPDVTDTRSLDESPKGVDLVQRPEDLTHDLIEMEVVVMKSVPTFDPRTGQMRYERRPQTVRTYMRP
jgi:hypothetical protein